MFDVFKVGGRMVCNGKKMDDEVRRTHFSPLLPRCVTSASHLNCWNLSIFIC